MVGLVAAATLIAAAICAALAYRADRDLRAFRLPGAPPSVYRIPINRLRSNLYQPDGHPLVHRAWRALVAMLVILVLGLSLAVSFLICAGPQVAC